MPTVEIRVLSAELFKHMREMRGWLDSQSFEPSLFKFAGLGAETIITVVLGTSAEAEAFAKAFGGALTTKPKVAGVSTMRLLRLFQLELRSDSNVGI